MEEKHDNSKALAIVSLVLAVIALAVGFASFTATLQIQNATAIVAPNDTFSPNLQYKQGTLKCVRTGTQTEVTDYGEFNSSSHATIWRNAQVLLEVPGDSITCSATVENLSTFTANLKEINLSNKLVCTPEASGTTITGLDAACAEMHLTVNVSSASASADSTAANSNTSVSGVSIAPNGEREVSFTIAYSDSTHASTAATVDKRFIITIPTISFEFSTN